MSQLHNFYVPKYLSIAQFFPNLCLTFPCGLLIVLQCVVEKLLALLGIEHSSQTCALDLSATVTLIDFFNIIEIRLATF